MECSVNRTWYINSTAGTTRTLPPAMESTHGDLYAPTLMQTHIRRRDFNCYNITTNNSCFPIRQVLSLVYWHFTSERVYMRASSECDEIWFIFMILSVEAIVLSEILNTLPHVIYSAKRKFSCASDGNFA